MLVKLSLLLSGSLLFNLVLWQFLKRRKVYQVIYELSPQTHQTKFKTPSFGGIGIILTILIGSLFLLPLSVPVIWLLAVLVTFSLIGFIDDLTSALKGKNRGLSARQKFGLQLICALLLLLAASFTITPISLGMIGVFAFVMVGSSNATNLTDGLDGLLGGLSLLTSIGFLVYGLVEAQPLFIHFSAIMIVSLISFLIFNIHPAKFFMGDTGSLALGAVFAGLCVLMGTPWPLLPLGGVYIIETLSVIIQVAYFKRTQKRIFLMSPLHHHFELMGLSEIQTVMIFWLLGAAFLGIFIIAL